MSRFLDHANPSTAPFTYIVDGEQRQRRVILFGTGISETYGRDLTGFTLADMLPGSAERSVVARVRRVSSVHCGLIVVSGFMGRDNLPMRGTFLMLPLLKKAGETVIAGAAEFEYDIGSGASTTGSGRVALLQCIDIRPQTPV